MVSVPRDTNELVLAEVCFGQRQGARWFTRMCLPKAVRRGAQRSQRRFGLGERVACAVEDSSDEYTDWAAGEVVGLDHEVEEEDGVAGGIAPCAEIAPRSRRDLAPTRRATLGVRTLGVSTRGRTAGAHFLTHFSPTDPPLPPPPPSSYGRYEVRLDSGPTVLVHADEHWLVRGLDLP